MSMTITPLCAALGAEVQGLDLRQPVSDDLREQLHDAWNRHLVLVFRDQRLDAGQFLAASQIFGGLDMPPGVRYGRVHIPAHPEIALMSNEEENGKPKGLLGSSELVWHADMTFDELPPRGAILYPLRLPETGGETFFSNLYLAHDTLPEALRAQAQGRHAFHDGAVNSAGKPRADGAALREGERPPGAVHPLLRVHPATGRSVVFLGRRQKSYVTEWPDERGEALLDGLWAHATQPQFVYKHAWRMGDMLIWDNLATMHRRDALDASQPRTLYRTQISGRQPVRAAAEPA